LSNSNMATEEITQIKIGNFQVGIIGLEEAVSELSASMGTVSDEEVGRALVQRLSKTNYIPEKAKPDYGQAFVREFRKHLGQDLSTVQPEQGLVIRVLGQGCANCQALSQRIMEVLTELNMAADFEHVTDTKEIARYGVLQSPALIVNGQIMARGTVPNKAQLGGWLKKATGF
jgi:small redox-active disulfide protein 2